MTEWKVSEYKVAQLLDFNNQLILVVVNIQERQKLSYSLVWAYLCWKPYFIHFFTTQRERMIPAVPCAEISLMKLPCVAGRSV